MKERKVLVTIVIESSRPVKEIGQICKYLIDDNAMRVVELTATVQQPVKGEK